MPLNRRAWLAALAALPAGAGARVHSRVPTVTRLVKLFLERESALFEAEATRDATALGQLLAPDFEQRDAAAPGQPQPRAAWLAARLAATAPMPDVDLSQMAVHDLGERALVSFLAQPEGGAARYLVDLWVRAGDDWRLKVRYSAPSA